MYLFRKITVRNRLTADKSISFELEKQNCAVGSSVFQFPFTNLNLAPLISGAFRQGTPNGYLTNNGRDTNSPLNNSDSDYKYGRFDASALHIAHALKQTEVQKAYNKGREKPIDLYLVSSNYLLL